MFGNTEAAWRKKNLIVVMPCCYHIVLQPGSNLWYSPVEAWADAFRSSPDLTGVVSVYEDLRRKGLEFPMTELEGYSPVQAPKTVQTLLANCC